jgi:hypothetical protein
MAQVVDTKALISNPSTTKKNKTKTKLNSNL